MPVVEFGAVFVIREVTSEEEEGPTKEQNGVSASEDKGKEEESK